MAQAQASVTIRRRAENGRSYWIVPSASSIKRTADGALHPQRVSARRMRSDGASSSPSVTQDYPLRYYIYAADGNCLSYGDVTNDESVPVPADCSEVSFQMVSSAQTIAKATVPVIDDGEPGEPGKDASVLVATPSEIAYDPRQAQTMQCRAYIAAGSRMVAPPSGVALFLPNGQPWPAMSRVNGVRWTIAPSGGDWICVEFNFTEGSTLTGQAVVSTSYLGQTLQSVINIRPAAQGSAGPAGLVCRTSEWQEGVEYHNDKELLGSQDVCFLDLVCKTDAQGRLKGYWECRKTHVASAETDPEREQEIDGVSEHWERFNQLLSPVYTPLLLAENSVVRFMQGNQLKIYGESDDLKAGISAASGMHPIIYTNPKTYPVAVSVGYMTDRLNAVARDYVNRDDLWHETSVANGYYLHARWVITYSDGSTQKTMTTGLWRNNTGADAPTSEIAIAYAAGDASAPIGGWGGAIATTPARPILWSRLASANFTHQRSIAQIENSESPTDGAFQVRDDGSATFGTPGGARVVVNAAPPDGLPRIEVYDTKGDPTAKFDGSRVSSASELFSATGATAELMLPPSGLTASHADSGFAMAEATQSMQIEATADGVLVIPSTPIVISAHAGYERESADCPEGQSAQADVIVDGAVKSSFYLPLDSGDQQDTYATVEFNASARVPVVVGQHTVSVRVRFYGYRNGAATVTTPDGLRAETSSDIMMCRYFANGFAIGSATNNYCMAWDNGSAMQFIIENPSYGLSVTSDGVKVKRSAQSGWINL